MQPKNPTVQENLLYIFSAIDPSQCADKYFAARPLYTVPDCSSQT